MFYRTNNIMITSDLVNGSKDPQRLNESLEKTFGKRIKFENFNLHQLHDARNRLRTQMSQFRSASKFNDVIENPVFLESQWMIDAITAEINRRDEYAMIAEQKSAKHRKLLKEGEIQQASTIVTAKTMVDRVSRWIEELSGMENDTLLQLGDAVRDEMGQEIAKRFIEQVAPAIQGALEHLKQTRETIASGVRVLTGEEQTAELLGNKPDTESNAMTVGPVASDQESEETDDMTDDFGAADAAVGGSETAGREQRESIDRKSIPLYGSRVRNETTELSVEKDDPNQTVLVDKAKGTKTVIDKKNPNSPKLQPDASGKVTMSDPNKKTLMQPSGLKPGTKVSVQ